MRLFKKSVYWTFV